VPSERGPRRTLVLLAVGAVGVRVVYLAAFASDYKPRQDARHYQLIASAFSNGDGISALFPFTYLHPTAFRPPLYPALLGAFYWVTASTSGSDSSSTSPSAPRSSCWRRSSAPTSRGTAVAM
jgi:hypothetical protein